MTRKLPHGNGARLIHRTKVTMLERRKFLAFAGVSLFIPRPVKAANIGARKLSLDNLHTGEKLTVDYWIEGQYQPEALAEVNRLLRDFRTG